MIVAYPCVSISFFSPEVAAHGEVLTSSKTIKADIIAFFIIFLFHRPTGNSE